MKTLRIWLSKTFKFRLSLLLVNVILGGAMNACDNDPEPTPIRIAGPEDVTSYDALGGGKLGFLRDGDFFVFNAKSDFFVINADTKSSWGFRSIGSSSMSPDGKYIAYYVTKGTDMFAGSEMFLYDIEGDKSKDRRGGYNPSWTADSKNLLFGRQTRKTHKLIRQSIADDTESTITTGANLFPRMSVSESDKLVFIDTKEVAQKPVRGIYTMNMDGTQVTQLVADGIVRTSSPAWSPNGEQIAYIGTQLDTTTNTDYCKQIDIIIIDKKGANGITIASFKPAATRHAEAYSQINPSISWSPDGTRLAFNMPEAAGIHIFVINSDGTGLTQVTSRVGVYDGDVQWSR